MAAEGNNIRRYIYRGEAGEVIPRDGHIIVIVHEGVTVILANAFRGYHNIVELICHEGVEKIEREAFDHCTSLRRVIMPCVEIAEGYAFYYCTALTDVECNKLEIIEEGAFHTCTSLRSINLTSVEMVEQWAFCDCTALTDAKFGNKLRRIEERAFIDCRSLERITIPLKDGLITHDAIFQGCENLKHVDLVRGALHETIDALLLEVWRNDMNEEIESINQILPNADAGYYDEDDVEDDAGGKALVIRRWIRSVLLKINHYKTEHQRVLNEAGSTLLHHALPHDIVMNNVLPFLVLPSHTFEVEDNEEDDSDDEDEIEE
mmetsp:Transcript_23260/g.33216  ORF Transcript_23260/g.33216 Transcript_23260/m.33216 type:complete len:319 (+) Transcript_23260:318-1274(+)